MPYDFAVDAERDYLRVEVSGNRSPDIEQGLRDIMTVWSRVTDICRETNTEKVLAVLQLKGEVPVMGSYNVVTHADQFGWSRRLRMAVVDLNDESREGNRFTETVAVNRGYQIKVFDNENDAKDWLSDTESPA